MEQTSMSKTDVLPGRSRRHQSRRSRQRRRRRTRQLGYALRRAFVFLLQTLHRCFNRDIWFGVFRTRRDLSPPLPF
ncbi:unnamed protein product [Zymoseptoria tritici ST99CH_3D7]|uniref:Uncharacterized protein n=1 Tax=Zymoseptoria tritici (strain ST99CH_3D7) TaxID=1276538 RepID=A0A1X7SA87_ZYMT9|nr:unnamed protein product [Zymoseptoria tritici ST99CH_3D7]